jgi:hypothetical protein
MPISLFASALSELELTDSSPVNTIGVDSPESDLELSDLAETQHKLESVVSELELSDALEPTGITSNLTQSDLSLSDQVTATGPVLGGASNQLPITDSVTATSVGGGAINELDFEHLVEISQPISVSPRSDLFAQFSDIDPEELAAIDPFDPEQVAELFRDIGLRHNLSYNITHHPSIQIWIPLGHQAAPTAVGEADDHIHLSHEARVVLYETPSDKLNLLQTVIINNVSWTEQAIRFTNLAEANIVSVEEPQDSLGLNSSVSYAVVNFCDYTPGIGDGLFTYTPPSIVAPTLIRRPTTVLTWPYASPTFTIELRNPSFDNVEQFEFRRVNRRTRGGTLDLFRDENWPKARRLIYSFTWLSEENRNELFKFLQRSLGQEVGILDFESRQWRGIITTPSSAISQPKRDGHSVSLQLEGELA